MKPRGPNQYKKKKNGKKLKIENLKNSERKVTSYIKKLQKTKS